MALPMWVTISPDFPGHFTNFHLDTAAKCSFPDMSEKFWTYGNPMFPPLLVVVFLHSTLMSALSLGRNLKYCLYNVLPFLRNHNNYMLAQIEGIESD